MPPPSGEPVNALPVGPHLLLTQCSGVPPLSQGALAGADGVCAARQHLPWGDRGPAPAHRRAPSRLLYEEDFGVDGILLLHKIRDPLFLSKISED